MCNIDLCSECHYILPFEETREFNSPLAKYLGTNHNPTDAQRHVAVEVIAEISLSIRILEEQISRLRKSTDRLELYKREHEVLLSKFQDFPPEILGLIFQTYVDSCATRKEIVTTDDLNFKPGDVRGMPRSNSRMHILLTITAVCRQWRMIALSMSSLWNNIHLSLGFRELEKWEKMAPRFIRRAGQHRLSIDVDLDEWNNAERGRVILHNLGSMSERWKEAQFMLSSNTIGHFKAAITKLDGRLPELEFLSLGMSASDSAPLLRLAVAPKLRALQLINLRPERLCLPWCQIQDLSLIHIHWRHTLNLIQLCPNLASLRCEVFDSRFDSLHADQDILVSHQHLSSLELITSSRNCTFMDALELPGLSSLALITQSAQDCGEHFQMYQFPTLLRFLSRSRCTLQSLSLENMIVCPKDFVEYLSLFSDLTTLKLTESTDVPYDDILKLLTITELEGHTWMMEGTGPVLPLLCHLEYTYASATTLWGPSYYDAIFESVNRVIASRSTLIDKGSSVQRLRSVKILGPRPDIDPERVFAYRELLGFHCKEFSVETYFFAAGENPKPDVVSCSSDSSNGLRFWNASLTRVGDAQQAIQCQSHIRST